MKMLTRRNIATVLVLTLGFSLVWFAFSQPLSKIDTPIDLEAYQEVMAREVVDLYELEELIRDERSFYEIITPPAEDLVLRQPLSAVVPFSWNDFPQDVTALLADRYEYAYSVPVYTLRVVEDRVTRQLTFYDKDNEALFALDKPEGYDPFALLKTRYPGLYSGRYALSEVEAMEAAYDPARMEMLVTLVPTDYVEPYLYVQERVAAYQRSLMPEGIAMMRGMGADSNLVITAASWTSNGLLLEMGYPDTFTNRLDIYRATDLLERDWQRVLRRGRSRSGQRWRRTKRCF